MKPGCHKLEDGVYEFCLWAPFIRHLELHVGSQTHALSKGSGGYWRAVLQGIEPGTPYFYQINHKITKPDPASFYQSRGVFGPSVVIDHDAFAWTDHSFVPASLTESIIYELHIGTFTPRGTFDSAIPRLKHLKSLGVNAVEIMPVAQFSGRYNWGYDGVFPYAVQNTYGGPDGLKRFVNAAHQQGISVILDVVYNHIGPEGNCLHYYGPYFTTKYKTPWGKAVNLDGRCSEGVRSYFLNNALYWFKCFHIDGLRVDAIDAMRDHSEKHFLKELTLAVEKYSRKKRRPVYLIAESDFNDEAVVMPRRRGGLGFDAQWNDDFHHALHSLCTKEKNGYYQDYGTEAHFLKALKEHFVLNGTFSNFRKKNHGKPVRHARPHQFVAYLQNHDQIGNRKNAERISSLVSADVHKLMAAVLFTSGVIPLMFMGEEYGEQRPFYYFIDHQNQRLVNAVNRARKWIYKEFGWKGRSVDHGDEQVFQSSKLDWRKKNRGKHKIILDFYKRLIKIRREDKVMRQAAASREARFAGHILTVFLKKGAEQRICLYNFSDKREIYTFKEKGRRLISLNSSGKERKKSVLHDESLTMEPYQFLFLIKQPE